ncbi:MAG: translation initiation factor IF-2 [Lachnospiraceae bacterium]|nr:translation initiation factor IF-2 [Lachnospiraceae bacterium]
MAKVKVHELAKEINKSSKEVISFLSEKGIELKSHMSSLEDEQVSMIKKSMAGSADNKPPKEVTAQNVEATTPVETKQDEIPVKKKKPNIIFVNNPYNSRSNEKGNRQTNQGRGRQVGQIGGNSNGNTNGNTTKSTTAIPSREPIKASDVSEAFARAIGKDSKQTQEKPMENKLIDSKPMENKPVDRKESENMQEQIKIIETKEMAKPIVTEHTKEKMMENKPQTAEGNATNATPTSNNANGERKIYNSYNNNNRQNSGERRPYNNDNRNSQNSGERRPYNNNNNTQTNGERRPYNNNNNTQTNGERRPYNNNNNTQMNGERRPYNNNNTQTNGERRPYNNDNRNGQNTRPGGYNNNGQGQRTGGTDNRQPGSRPYTPGQGNYQNNRGTSQGGNRDPRNNDNRSQGQRSNDRPGFRSQARPQAGGKPQGFVSESPIKEQEKYKGNQDRRRLSQDKRKRDIAYERDLEAKTKKFNPHGFIKPEKVETTPEEKIKVITLPDSLTIKELAEKMKMQPSAIVKKLFLQGTVVTVNQEISYEQAEEIAIEYEIICEQEVKVDVIEELLKEEEEDTTDMSKRPPVICVMGHVDHGKTSLLDAIRKTNVTDREAGGITQHIGAYVVNTNGEKITFLDTPGHEAFTSMRMRGANSTDIAILVVAADDGVMPQTVEAINHAKAAGIEIIVAVNKIDKPNANIERVKQELTEYELISEDWGGSTVFAPVSAKSGEGIEQLLEMILLTSEMLELKANTDRQARGLVIEAELDKGRGPVATVLVQKGTLHVGDFIAAGACHGKVRAMIDDKGKRVKEAGPSTPVEILGLNDVPNAGEIFVAPDNDREAKNFAATFISQNKVKLLDDTKQKMSLDDLFSQIKEGNLKELNLIVKADVQGSVEAVKQSLSKLSNEEVIVKVIHSGVGAINESDVILASASNAIIIGFNVRPDVTAKNTAETEGVDVRLYKVIYQAIEDVEAAMKGMLDPIFEEKVIGHAEIRQIFKASDIGNIAGSYVLDGTFERGCSVRITRAGEQVFEGPLASLKRFKDDVKEVKTGFECGLVFEGFGEMEELDVVEAYKMVQVERK